MYDKRIIIVLAALSAVGFGQKAMAMIKGSESPSPRASVSSEDENGIIDQIALDEIEAALEGIKEFHEIKGIKKFAENGSGEPIYGVNANSSAKFEIGIGNIFGMTAFFPRIDGLLIKDGNMEAVSFVGSRKIILYTKKSAQDDTYVKNRFQNLIEQMKEGQFAVCETDSSLEASFTLIEKSEKGLEVGKRESQRVSEADLSPSGVFDAIGM